METNVQSHSSLGTVSHNDNHHHFTPAFCNGLLEQHGITIAEFHSKATYVGGSEMLDEEYMQKKYPQLVHNIPNLSKIYKCVCGSNIKHRKFTHINDKLIVVGSTCMKHLNEINRKKKCFKCDDLHTRKQNICKKCEKEYSKCIMCNKLCKKRFGPKCYECKKGKIILNVSFHEKDEAKKMGAQFDWGKKKWYILRNNVHAERMIERWGK
tara:strand:- start:97 stop:726 length:630 start_codon:yes stop_codon:yes gene_type:complete